MNSKKGPNNIYIYLLLILINDKPLMESAYSNSFAFERKGNVKHLAVILIMSP